MIIVRKLNIASAAEKIAAIVGGIARIRCGGAGRPTDSATGADERN
jgi:hypothetical protein